MTRVRASRKDAVIRRGANTSARRLLGALLLAAACNTDPPERRDQALFEARSKVIESAERDAPAASLTGIDVYSGSGADAAGARVVLTFAGAPLFEQRQLPADGILPPRVAIELENTVWGDGLPMSQPVGRGGLERVRLAMPNARVVLDLRPGASGRVFYLTDPYRIVIDVQRRDRTRAKRRPVVVLDPGHGGSEPGAANEKYGLVESRLALTLAELTADRLVDIMPQARVLLTRSADVDLSLEERCALANAMEADVFVSIHLNASSETLRKGGVATFVLDTTNDRQALRLAARENDTRVAEVTGVQSLLATYHREGQAAGSIDLANSVQHNTLKAGRMVYPAFADRGVRQSMFYVLVGARMPAVLLEASFLSYEPEARALATSRYRNALAHGIASGIASYLRRR